MTKNDVLTLFFSKQFENEINEKMMYYSYSFEYESVKNYIMSFLSISVEDYLQYIINNYDVNYLESSDIYQFSNFDDCSINICKSVKEAGDKGFSALEIGKLLENDGIERKDGAYLKYGENHAKTAVGLGLMTNLSNKFFLSCLGFVLNDFDSNTQKEILARLILRNKLIQRLVYKVLINGKSSYFYETGFLSKSTQLRRKSNIKFIVDYFCSIDENKLTNIKDKIIFDN